MKYITVKLTPEQAATTVQALEWAQDDKYMDEGYGKKLNPGYDAKHDAFLKRIITKIVHASHKDHSIDWLRPRL